MAKKEKKAKAKNAPQAKYDAASNGRRMAGWSAPTTGPNKAIEGLQKIRDRARDIGRNEWSAAANIRVWTTNIVGTGIVPRPKTKVKALKEKLTAAWDAWVPNADADFVLDFYGLQALAARSWFTSGEVFVRARPRRMSDGINVPMQIQVLEADMCPLLDLDVGKGLAAGHKIRQGIELDYIGRRVAYWFFKDHPGDNYNGGISLDMLSRVPAEYVCHVFDPMRPGQLRGVPEMAPVIVKLKNIADFDDAVLERQHLANLFTTFIIRPTPSGANDPMTGMPYQGALDEPIATLEPGASMELLPGEDVRFSDPPDAGANYSDYHRTQMLGVAAGTGTPYELMTGDLKDVSDRTLRILINEFRRLCEQRQWLLFIPQMLQKIRVMWADFAVIAGVLTEAEAVEAKNITWATQGWAYIHPVQDVQAKQLEVEAGFRSRSSVIAERGEDPDSVDEERAEDKDREDELGLTPPPPETPDTSAKDAADAEDKKQKAEDRKAKAQLHTKILSLFDNVDE